MTVSREPASVRQAEIHEASEARVARWIGRLSGRSSGDDRASGDRGAGFIDGVRRDAEGLAFTWRLLGLALSSEDPFAAAVALRGASRETPPSLPSRDRLALRAGGLAALGLPWAVLPLVRARVLERVSDLVLAVHLPSEDSGAARPDGLRSALRASRESGAAPVLALGGAAVLGPAGVAREVERLVALAREPEVSHLAVDPSRLAPSRGDWSFDADVGTGTRALAPVLTAASGTGTVVLLEPSDGRGARLAPEMLLRVLADPGLHGARAGLVLPAELPESREWCERLLRAARLRVEEGGAPLELSVGVRGLHPGERIASILDGLPVPTLETRAEQGAQLLRIVELAVSAAGGARPSVRLTIASEDPFLLAAGLEIAKRHDPPANVVVELRSGVAPRLAEVLREEGLERRLRRPLVARSELSGMVGGLVALAAEAADPDSALARFGAIGDGDARRRVAVVAELEAARAVLAQRSAPPPAPRRVQLRAREWDPSERDSALFYRAPADPDRFDTGGLTAAVLGLTLGETGQVMLEERTPRLDIPVVSASGFANEPVTDLSRRENRAWMRGILSRAAASDAGTDAVERAREAANRPGPLVRAAREAAAPWRALPHGERARRLRRAALGTVAARDRLIEVLAAEGVPASIADAEVSGAVDAARYLGQLSAGLAAVRGAEFHPDALALVVIDAGFPLSFSAEAVLAAVAAGSGAVVAAHSSVARSVAVLIEEWEEAGLPAGLVVLAVARGGSDPGRRRHRELASGLASSEGVDRALVCGERATARALVRARPDLRIDGRFLSRGSLLVAPGADLEQAARDVAASAFAGSAGDPSRIRSVVLLGGVARSRRFRDLLADAVRRIPVGDPAGVREADPLAVELGPLPEPPDDDGARALTSLAAGEEWLVAPERRDERGLLWSPGVRLGVRPGSPFWDQSAGLPVIGVMPARTLQEAIALQNAPGGGGVAALHSLDPAEILPWLDGVEAATLVVGGATTGARVERRPGGGWHEAGIGIQALAAGPNRLLTLGSWTAREGTRSSTLHLRGLDPEVRLLIEAAQTALDYPRFDRVRRAALADALSWRTALGVSRDTAGLGIERNVLRHRPVPAQLRLAEGAELAELVRVLAAALLVRAPVAVSTGVVLPPELSVFLQRQQIDVSLERDDDWLERLVASTPAVGTAPVERIRLIGGDRVRTSEWLGGLDRVAVWAEPVTMAGPVELLAFLREQSIAITAHRFGLSAPIPEVEEWLAALAR